MSAKKKLFIKTYGCQMNVYDSTRMEDLLTPLGYEAVDAPDDADMVVLNTCHIREKAAEKMYSELGRIRKKRRGKKTIVAVAGCVGQAEGEEIFRRAPFVDVVVGPQSYHNLPDLVMKVERDAGHAINLDFPTEPKFDTLPETTLPQGISTFLTIQEGCDKFCTFCVVPYTRGAEYSRPFGAIYREAVRMVAGGTKEITLLGQNVNAYHGEDDAGKTLSLGKLIRHLAKIEGLERIRYTTSHPRDVDAEQIAVHGEEPKLMPYLHLPIQSGSNDVLRRMNRKHTVVDYLRTVEKLRMARPDLVFSGDFIVGFPGETDQHFEETLQLVKDVRYAQAYSFKYSPRPGTPGSEMEDQVPEEVKTERLARLQALLNEQQLTFNQSMIGEVLPVLFDREGKQNSQIVGRTPYMQSVYITGIEGLMGRVASVAITGGYANSLTGEIVNHEAPVAA